MDDLITAISQLLAANGSAVIAIDGRCGSGKTTLASRLAELFGGRVIHMDDFFLPPELRTAERLAKAGENVHHERFARQVLPLLGGGSFELSAFCCATGEYVTKTLPAAPLTVVEGTYSLHPALRQSYDLRVFCHISPETQRERILRREGDRAQMFFDRWIPLEEAYFDTLNIRQASDIILDMEKNVC